MKAVKQKLTTVVTERAIEEMVLRDIKRLGAKGYVLVEARGEDARGIRHAEWEANRDVRVEIICDESLANVIAAHLMKSYYDDYDMTIFFTDIDVIARKEKT